MKLNFLNLSEQRRRRAIEEAATRRMTLAVIVEKDFWVCWMLSVIFESPFTNDVVFKGGTSLSKVFGVIDRFSEDIDLSLSPEFLKLPVAGASRNQAHKWMERAEAACSAVVRDELRPVLEAVIRDVLGARDSAWLEFQTDALTNSPVLLFHYPTTQPPGFDYLRRSVKLEFGSLTEQRPVARHSVRPWLADVFPAVFSDWSCEVVALEIERTFWEKATILHAEHYRPPGRPTPDRFSRHYADTAALASHPAGVAAVDQTETRDRVVQWKSQFFGSSWARYDLAVPGTFRLLPATDRVASLQRDYQAMKDMYLSEPVSFDSILETLTRLEDRINDRS